MNMLVVVVSVVVMGLCGGAAADALVDVTARIFDDDTYIALATLFYAIFFGVAGGLAAIVLYMEVSL